MEFFIKQNTNLPIIKMDVVMDARTDAYEEMNSILDNHKTFHQHLDLIIKFLFFFFWQIILLNIGLRH